MHFEFLFFQESLAPCRYQYCRSTRSFKLGTVERLAQSNKKIRHFAKINVSVRVTFILNFFSSLVLVFYSEYKNIAASRGFGLFVISEYTLSDGKLVIVYQNTEYV